MDIIITIILGGIVGWLASLIMKTGAQMGILANVVVGIVGSWLGFWVAGLAGIAAYGAVGRFLVAIIGAVLLIAILKGFKILK